jgi:hypothetical protein
MCYIPFMYELMSPSQLQATLQPRLLQGPLPEPAEAKRSSSEAKPWRVTAAQMQADFLAGNNTA